MQGKSEEKRNHSDEHDIRLSESKLIPISEVPPLLPRFGSKKIHKSTVWRWCSKGLKGVRLEHVKIGRRICTTRDALDRFFDSLAEKDTMEGFRVPTDSDSQVRHRRHQITDAKRTLEDAGF